MSLKDDTLMISKVTPGITAIEYYQRRQKLAELLPKDSVAILAAGDIKYRPGSAAVFYQFYQDPDFLYLTGTFSTHRIASQACKADSCPTQAFSNRKPWPY